MSLTLFATRLPDVPKFRLQGCAIVCEALVRMGIDTVFGIPGTQSVPLFEALRRSPLKTILPTTELAGAFMANGYFRVSGRPAVLITIQGPGFTYATTGLAEALHDSAALLHLVVTDDYRADRHFQLQRIDHPAVAGPITKAIFSVEQVQEIPDTLTQAYEMAMVGEPGPVSIMLSRSVLKKQMASEPTWRSPKSRAPMATEAALTATLERLAASRKTGILAGQGAQAAAAQVVALAQGLNTLVVTTCSGRGVIAEDHPLALNCDFSLGYVDAVNRLFAACDVVLALGCKFSHNGTAGFKLKIDQEKLIHVDAAKENIGVNYPPAIAVHADVGSFLNALLERQNAFLQQPQGFDDDAQLRFRQGVDEKKKRLFPNEPLIDSATPPDLQSLFTAIRQYAKPGTVFVTDSGRHQLMARNYLTITQPRGLIVPTDFQSMGYGIPAAIGAGMHSPGTPVVAIVGDGSMAMSTMELATAVAVDLDLAVILFNDGCLGAIRMQQLMESGDECCVQLNNADFGGMAAAFSAGYSRLYGDVHSVLTGFLQSSGTRILEVPLKDCGNIDRLRRRSRTRRLLYESPLHGAIKKIRNVIS